MTKLNNRGNWTLLGVLIGVAIVFVAVGIIYGKIGGPSTVSKDSELLDPHSTKQTVVGKSLDTAKAHVCREQLGQIRQGILAYKAMGSTEANPPTMRDIGLSVGMEFYQCPMTGQPYRYDAATGTVQCPTHVKF